MKPEDLRAGNYIKDYQNKKTVKVTIEILQEILNGMDYYEPIQITEELIKSIKEFIREEMEEGYYYSCDLHEYDLSLLSSDDFDYVYLFPYDKKFEYLHEVQNFYYDMRKKELTINLQIATLNNNDTAFYFS